MTAGASWSLEQLLPGRRPVRMTADLTEQIARVCAAFPTSEGPPAATPEDLAEISARLPAVANVVDRLSAEFARQVRGVPSILRHGDLWAGNMLVAGRRLTGLIDWDAAHPAALPGADLLQVVATELRRQTRRQLGPAFLSRPWRLRVFSEATRAYWRVLGIRPGETLLTAVGIAWWAAEVSGTLARLPHRATDARWIATNVEAVLESLRS
jgi:aminoglycoside phosphotransferase (APT) family kinase protein